VTCSPPNQTGMALDLQKWLGYKLDTLREDVAITGHSVMAAIGQVLFAADSRGEG